MSTAGLQQAIRAVHQPQVSPCHAQQVASRNDCLTWQQCRWWWSSRWRWPTTTRSVLITPLIAPRDGFYICEHGRRRLRSSVLPVDAGRHRPTTKQQQQQSDDRSSFSVVSSFYLCRVSCCVLPVLFVASHPFDLIVLTPSLSYLRPDSTTSTR